MKAITVNQINYLNIGLMLISCIVAFFLPFELFLFSYAVLGPLHYLTEIGWLHKKNYYTKGKYDFVFLVLLCVLVFYFSYVQEAKSQTQVPNFVAYGLIISAVFVFVKDTLYRVVICILALIGLALTHFGSETEYTYVIWVGVFLPTIIHVFIFTWLFMFYGVLKNKSLSGFLSVAALLLISASFFIFRVPHLQYEVSEYIRSSYKQFYFLNTSLLDTFNMAPEQVRDESSLVYQSNPGFVIMRFIAFAYTYHYLNWFSKTSVIQWHKVPRRTLVITLVIWIASVAIYRYDYNIGIKALFFLSFLHVFLEFPLNITSFHGIIQSLRGVKK
ncbi:MAG: hypothetical protein JST26_07470 [Bacteroidetes bacterium]|nr:hypothetical protein [Bacteroidota bacterium]